MNLIDCYAAPPTSTLRLHQAEHGAHHLGGGERQISASANPPTQGPRSASSSPHLLPWEEGVGIARSVRGHLNRPGNPPTQVHEPNLALPRKHEGLSVLSFFEGIPNCFLG